MKPAPFSSLTEHFLKHTIYKLGDATFSLDGSGAGLLTVNHPLSILRLGQDATCILRNLSEPRSLSVISEATGINALAVGSILSELVLVGAITCDVPALDNWPSVSIVIPSFQREIQLRRCVLALIEQNYDEDKYEIIVVDDGSPVPLRVGLEDLPIAVHRFEMNRGPAAARNEGARIARGQIVLFVDSDCEARSSSWLRAVIKGFVGKNVIAVGARALSPPGRSVAAAFEVVRSPLDMGPVPSSVGFGHPVAFLPSCALAIRKLEFLESGGFDERFFPGEDVDLIWRLAASGHHIKYEPTATLLHHSRERWRDLLGRRFEYGSSEAAVQSRHPQCRRSLSVSAIPALLMAASAWRGHKRIAGSLASAAALSSIHQWAQKAGRVRQLDPTISKWTMASAIARGYGADLYHLGADLSRYHGVPLAVAAIVWPPVRVTVLTLMATPVVADFFRSSTSWRSLPQFTFLALSESVVYQAGLLKGCIEERTVLPLISWPRFTA